MEAWWLSLKGFVGDLRGRTNRTIKTENESGSLPTCREVVHSETPRFTDEAAEFLRSKGVDVDLYRDSDVTVEL